MLKALNRNLLKYSVKEDFFDKWTTQMAYILGFTFADGNIYKTSLAWDIQSRDKDLLVKIKNAMNSTYQITNRAASVRLRMNNQNLNKGIVNKGLIENKAKRMILPDIPKYFVRHFVRGFLDGDGWIIKRSNRNEVDLGFVSGNKIFLKNLSVLILKNIGIQGRVREKNKITLKGCKSKTYLMEFYSNNAVNIATWIYKDLKSDDIYLDRKYRKYLEVKKLTEYLQSGTKKIREVQKNFDKSLKEILLKYHTQDGLDGVQIAKILGVHSSSIYRWLEKTGLKYPEHRKLNYE